VFAITGKHVIVFANRGNRADGDRFLADVQVAEAADFAGDVSLGGFFFEASNEQHLTVEIDELLVVETGKTIFLALFRFVSFAGDLFLIYVGWRVDNAG